MLKKGISLFLALAMVFCTMPMETMAAEILTGDEVSGTEKTTEPISTEETAEEEAIPAESTHTDIFDGVDENEMSAATQAESAIGDAALRNSTAGPLNYSVNEDGTTCTVTDCDESISGAFEIPSKIDGYTVTEIGPDAFSRCSTLESVTIPEGVTIIEYSAFQDCSALESITIPKSVIYIGSSVFQDCSALKSITIPEGVTSIAVAAFEGCSALESITIPEGVTYIGESAFEGCSALESITIPEGVAYIEKFVFQDCSALKSITIPESVTKIKEYAFLYCSSLKNITIPQGVTSIGHYAFCGCSSLESITIPEGVTEILDSTFSACSSLESIIIPEGVTSIGSYAFNDCASLKNIIIPEGIASIGSATFSGCSSLENITIPESVTYIGYWAFQDCSSLKNIAIPEGVTSIGHSAFRNCSKLESITIPEGVTSIAENTFYWCSSLKQVTLPLSIKKIENGAFAYSSQLQDVYYAGSKEDRENIEFQDESTELLQAIWHYNSTGPDDPGIPAEENWQIRYFTEWDAENQIAYFEDDLLHLGVEVTDETDTSFLADVENMVGNYVLVATKERTDDLVGPDILLSMQPVTEESRFGKIEEITSDSVKISTGETLPFGWNFTIQSDEFPQYQNEFALCYLYEDLVFEIKIVNLDVGTITGYDKAAGTITIGDTVYQISTLADETIETLLESSPEGQAVYYYADADNMIYRALLCTAEAPEEAGFDADIYRANQLLDPDQYVYAYSIIDDIARQTPSGAYAEAMSSNKEFKEAVLLWDSSTTAVDVLQKGPTEGAKVLMEKKDIYTALILASLQKVSEKDVGEKVAETGKKVNSALKKAAGDIKNALKLDLFVTEQYQSMTNSQKEEVKKVLEKELANISGLKNGIQIAESVDKLLETTSSFMDLYNMLLDNIYLVTMAESQKQLVTEMYENCSDDTPVNLKAALLQCKTIAESSYEEVVTGTLTYSFATSNFKAVADSYWKLLIKTAEKVDPMLAAMSAGYKVGKASSNLLFNTDGVVEQYYKVVAITELEELAFITLNNLQEQYRSSRNAEDARFYLAMCDLLYGIFSVDCAQAIALVDEMDSAALTEWAKLLAAILGNENSQAGSYEEAKKTLESLQSLYERSHKNILTVWVEYLPEDYPNTNLYEYYTDLISEDSLSMQKRLLVACPVNVQILNENGQSVASVVDGRISSSGNVAVQLENDKKTFYFYDNADYKVAIQGYATGSMNVTGTEYNELQQEIRNVYYNNIAVTPQSNYQMNVCGEQLQLSSFQLLDEQSAPVEQTLDTSNAGDATMYTVQIENGALQVNGVFSTQAQVYPGQQVNIYASGLSNQELLRWEISGNVNLEDDTALTTHFIMPDEDVSLKAILTPTNLDPTVPEYDIPSGLTAIYGQILADVELPENWSWKTPKEKVGDVGNREFEAIYTPNPAETDKTVTELLTVTVSPRDIVGADVELGESLTYNGQNQSQSIKAVTKDGETVTYQVTGNTGRNAGNYTMTVTGNGNFTGTIDVAWCIASANYNFEIPDQKVAFDSKLSDVQCESTAIGVGQEHVVGTLSWYLDDTYEQKADENYIFTGEDFITLYWKFVPAEGQNNYKKDPKQGKTKFELIERGGEQTTPEKDDSAVSNSTTGNSQEIEDNKTSVSNVPATNDSFQLELWIAVLLVSGMGIIFLSTARSQKRNKRKE